ncbi:MAG: DUF4258 domain-containing protein [Candidatus Aenigmarchaeota archaeon]|nr:DUF4258 domain-containing protein [Candidatus Aenigmarchaeota archaeon]
MEISGHARERMQKYNVSEKLLMDAINNPDSTFEGYRGRKIYQKRLDGYVLRIVIEENKAIKRIVTVYKARSGRYGI